ncbi:MAG TPA: WbqC family protein [Chitinophagaceae bacterium]|nr:WbqC family protein [Chitinophagaceae bacterium]
MIKIRAAMPNGNYDTLIIDNQYLPCVFYFKTLIKFKNVRIEQFEWYQKMSFRNRCFLAGPNGILSLSVPLEHGRNQKAFFKDVRICYKENWSLRHWRSIHDAYRKSPFFEFYADDIKSFFNKPPIFLFDWNMQWIEWFCKQTGILASVKLTDEYLPRYPENYTDLRDFIAPKNYIQFGKELPLYKQVFEDRNGFLPNLSILDALFCEGPAVSYLLH